MQNCYNTNGRKPLHEAESADGCSTERLEFVQDLTIQNRQLKQQLQQLQQQSADQLEQIKAEQRKMQTIQDRCNQRIDEVTGSLVKKHQHELAAVLNEKVEAEKIWYSEKQLLEAELLKLQHGLRDRQQLSDQLEQQVGQQQLELEDRNKELTELRSAMASLTQEKQAARQKLASSDDQATTNQRLRHDLSAANQKCVELQLKLDGVQRERELDVELEAERLRQLDEKDEQIEQLQEQIERLKKELAEARDLQLKTNASLRSLEDECAALREQTQSLRQQLQQWQGESSSRQSASESATTRRSAAPADANFRDYVAVKRELSALREENEQLRQRLRPNKKILK